MGPRFELELNTLLLAGWFIYLEQWPGFIWRRDSHLKVVLIKIRSRLGYPFSHGQCEVVPLLREY